MRFQVMWKKTHLAAGGLPAVLRDGQHRRGQGLRHASGLRRDQSRLRARIPGGMRSSGISTPRCTGTDRSPPIRPFAPFSP